MGKKYKRGNVKRKEKKITSFFEREKKLNRLINTFIKNVHHLKFTIEEYKNRDAQRLEIKRILDIQSREL